MFAKLRNSYHNASQWAHHHTAVLVFGLTALAVAFGWQFGSLIMGEQQTYAFEADPHGRCDTNSGSIAIPQSECLFLADIYTGNDGGNWTNIRGSQWFTTTGIESRHGIGLDGGNNITRFAELGKNINTDQTLDFSVLTELYHLDLISATVGGLYIAENTGLQNLFLSDISGISSIDLSPFANLLYFHWDHWSNGSTLQSPPDFSNNINIVDLSLNGHGLSSIDISSLNGLTSLSLGRNNLDESTLFLPLTTTLENLYIGNNNFTTINITPYTNLSTIDLSYNNLTSLDIASKTTITYLNLGENSISSFDVGNNTGIYFIDLRNNGLQTLTNFGNIQGFNEWNGLDDNMNGNCLDPLDLDQATITLLDTYFMNWGTNQTCGVFSCSLITDIPESECEVLVALYEDLEGDNWDDNTGWLQGNQICGNWNNVGCTYEYGDPHIQNLWLNGNNLSGTVDDLSSLPYLQGLWIGTWDWDEMYNVTFDLQTVSNLSLVDLEAQNVNLEGSLDDLSNSNGTLEYLALNRNDVMEFVYTPTQLGNFQELIQVEMSNLIVSGNIAPLANLQNLEILSLNCRGSSDYCDAYGDLSTFDGLTNLRELRLDSIGYLGSETNSTLSDIQNLTNLEYIALGGNDIEGELGAWIGNFQQLRQLEIDENMLSGELPAELQLLTQLETLRLGKNFFSGLLPDLIGFNNLLELELQRNNFVGTIPTTRGALTTLEQIGVGGRSFDNDMLLEGTLPDWSNLSNLSRIEIMFTNLEGNLPAYRGDLPIDHLAVFYNKFTGGIPTNRQNLASLGSMDRLWLNNNHLEGDIPSWIVDLNYDQSLKIKSNCLNTASVDSGSQLEQDLDGATNGTWRSQTNCLSDVKISKRLGQETVSAGDIIDLYIDYENIGSQKAVKVDVAEVLDPSLSILEIGSDPYIFGDIRHSYFNDNDVCYTDLLYNATGVYYNHINNILNSYLSEDVGDLSGLGYAIEQGFFGFNVEDLRLGLNEPLLSSEGAGLILFCAFVDVGMDQSAIVEAYDTLSSSCLPNAFAMKGRDFKSQGCGYSTEQGYIWSIGDIPAGASGTIHIKLQVADPLLPEQQLGLRTYLEMDGVNASTNELNFAIEGSQVVLLDPEDQGDEEPDNGSGESTPASQPSIGGGGPSGGSNTPLVEQDDCSDYTPPVDASSSYYDADCEADKIVDEEKNIDEDKKNEEHKAPFDKEEVLPTTQEILDELAKIPTEVNVDTERVEAYLMAKNIGMTTMTDFMAFQPGAEITRAAAAKYFVQYVETVLEKKADESRRSMCSNFDDIDVLVGQDLHEFVIRACMHKLMGLEKGVSILSSFRPYANLPRTEGATMVSRLLHGTTYDNTENQYTTRYDGHIQKLLTDNIITDGNPDLIEKRVYPLLMFLRWIKAE